MGPVTSGVPQGTVLGPLLFLLYVNDLDSVVKHSTIRLFADDVLIDASVNTLEECEALQDDLNPIAAWVTRWQLNLNSTKCEALMISNKHKPVQYTYSINQRSISWSNPV